MADWEHHEPGIDMYISNVIPGRFTPPAPGEHLEFTDDDDNDWCLACGQSWPCDSVRLSPDSSSGHSNG